MKSPLYTRRQKCLIKALLMCSKKKKRNAFEVLTNEMMDFICDACHNVLYNKKMKLSDEVKKKLSTHENAIFKLANKRGSRESRKKIVNQKGGAILPLILPLAAAVVSSIFK